MCQKHKIKIILTDMTVIKSLLVASNGILVSKVHNYNYMETKLAIICT